MRMTQSLIFLPILLYQGLGVDRIGMGEGGGTCTSISYTPSSFSWGSDSPGAMVERRMG